MRDRKTEAEYFLHETGIIQIENVKLEGDRSPEHKQIKVMMPNAGTDCYPRIVLNSISRTHEAASSNLLNRAVHAIHEAAAIPFDPRDEEDNEFLLRRPSTEMYWRSGATLPVLVPAHIPIDRRHSTLLRIDPETDMNIFQLEGLVNTANQTINALTNLTERSRNLLGTDFATPVAYTDIEEIIFATEEKIEEALTAAIRPLDVNIMSLVSSEVQSSTARSRLRPHLVSAYDMDSFNTSDAFPIRMCPGGPNTITIARKLEEITNSNNDTDPRALIPLIAAEQQLQSITSIDTTPPPLVAKAKSAIVEFDVLLPSRIDSPDTAKIIKAAPQQFPQLGALLEQIAKPQTNRGILAILRT